MNFNCAKWRGQYPSLSLYSDEQINGFASQIPLYFSDCNNQWGLCPAKKEQLEFLIVAHLATLDKRNSNGGLVGAITNASEGSVSLGTTMGNLGNIPAFWSQTNYGIAFWEATKFMRSGKYIPRRPNRRSISYP
ncbi:unnamed protein product [Commensalibacter communis]|uniref:Uncharacterized protein n=1 Tax=Commensalibacter communis TaxID=2972786 RepID=A0A9W4TRI9_9PROT|nr:DUF4054 domain-containing protein [Commensalibacter communis]CAI3941835.1 unnamed protein product [Commensalibacter communis]CAI3944794.1 unnamed protein product [Commensalibacter communis]CAI3959006.1 unnamed protein product [Commensalibacter communis]CAI3961041.1 unnamed protein product [Commensalibacter communis]